MSERWAVVNPDTLEVENVIIWGGGQSLWELKTLVQLEDNEPCAPGWIYDPSPMANPRFSEPVSGG